VSDSMMYLIMGLIAIPLIIGAIVRILYEVMAFAVNPVVVMAVILLIYFYIESLRV
jgi:hypothetical protein